MMWKMLSSNDTSTTCPSPLRNATMVANAPTRPVISSVSAMDGNIGSPPGWPLIAAMPPIDSAIDANPGRDA